MRYLLTCLLIAVGCSSLQAQVIPRSRLQAIQKQALSTKAANNSAYQVRLQKLAKDDLQAQLALATWCKKQRLFPEMRAHLAPVLEKHPDQPQARALLGQLKVGQQWLPKAKAYKAMGYTYHGGSWRSPSDMKEIREALARQRHLTRVSRDLRKLGRVLVGPDDKRSAKARDDFLALIRKEKLHRLGYEAEKAFYRSRKFWKEHRHAVAFDRVRGTLAVRAQMSQLLGFENYTTSLGTGSPVTIQLPRTRSIGIGSTVPFGR